VIPKQQSKVLVPPPNKIDRRGGFQTKLVYPIAMMRFNPFSPGGLVPEGVFTGRIEESKALERMLFNTQHGNPQHFLLHGERGIGKSSLSYMHELAASGRISPWDGEERFNFLTVSVVLEPSDTYASIIRKLGSALRRSLANHKKLEAKAKDVWDFLKRWEVMGVKYRDTEATLSLSELLDELAESYSVACSRISDALAGILVLIDEADKPTSDADLGSLLKGLTERVARTSPNTICFGLAGVSSVIDTIRQSHESALRLFTSFHLKPLSQDESVEIIRRGLKRTLKKTSVEVRIAPEAEQFIALYSEGYPHFIQQFAYCAFEADTDNNIEADDVKRGAWGEHGAFEQLGTKYFEGLYFDRIGSDDYRQVLRYMSEHLDGWVSKEDIRAHAKLKPSTLNNAIKALRDRQIIVPQPGQRGMYRLPTKSFAAWIRAFTNFPGSPELK
jgi:hypothetical protein